MASTRAVAHWHEPLWIAAAVIFACAQASGAQTGRAGAPTISPAAIEAHGALYAAR